MQYARTSLPLLRAGDATKLTRSRSRPGRRARSWRAPRLRALRRSARDDTWKNGATPGRETHELAAEMARASVRRGNRSPRSGTASCRRSMPAKSRPRQLPRPSLSGSAREVVRHQSIELLGVFPLRPVTGILDHGPLGITHIGHGFLGRRELLRGVVIGPEHERRYGNAREVLRRLVVLALTDHRLGSGFSGGLLIERPA